MIEATVVAGLTAATQTAAGDRVHIGARLQSGALPALVVRMPTGESAAVGDTLHVYTLELSAVAATMVSAQSLAAAAITKLRTYIVAQNASNCVIESTYAPIDDPVVGEGDEAEPAVCTANLTIYWTP